MDKKGMEGLEKSSRMDSSGKQSNSARAWALSLLPYLTLVVIHILFGWQMKLPVVFADELGYLGNARYLAGVAPLPDLRGCAFYHFGYSLFLLPAFRLFTDPVLTYKAAIITNSFLISSLYFPIYYVLHSLFENTKGISAVIAFASCLYPAFLVQSNVAWAENAFIPVYAFLIASFGAFLNHRSYRTAALFGFVAGFLYTIHPRGLPILPISILYLLVLGWFKVLPRLKTLTSIVVIGLIFLVTTLVNNHLQTLGWGLEGGRVLPFPLRNTLSEFISIAGLKNYLLSIAGQILYLLQSTYGLVFLGAFYVCSYIWNSREYTFAELLQNKKVMVLFFMLFSSIGPILAINLYFTNGITRSDELVYGRYNEGFLAFYIAFALLALNGKYLQEPEKRYKVIATLTVTIAALTLLIIVGRGYELFSKRWAMWNVSGIFPAIEELGRYDIGLISIISISLFAVIEKLSRQTFTAGIVLLMVTFFSIAAYDYKCCLTVTRHYTLPFRIGKLGTFNTLSYDMSFYNPNTFCMYQYLLGNTVFQRFHSDKGEMPASSVVISGKKWEGSKKLNAQFLASERSTDQVLWVLPGKNSPLNKNLSFIDVKLGAEKVGGVSESGFYTKGFREGKPVRWTNGTARLVIPVNEERSPTAIHIDLASTGPREAHIRILVNGSELYNEKHQGSLSKTFSLAGMTLGDSLTLELTSDTFVPGALNKNSRDQRKLGVLVRDIRLLTNVELHSDAKSTPVK